MQILCYSRRQKSREYVVHLCLSVTQCVCPGYSFNIRSKGQVTMSQSAKTYCRRLSGQHLVSFVIFNPLTANCRIYPAQQEYCIRQLLDISGDICLVHIGTWRQEYFVSGVYNYKKFDFDKKTLK